MGRNSCSKEKETSKHHTKAPKYLRNQVVATVNLNEPSSNRGTAQGSKAYHGKHHTNANTKGVDILAKRRQRCRKQALNAATREAKEGDKSPHPVERIDFDPAEEHETAEKAHGDEGVQGSEEAVRYYRRDDATWYSSAVEKQQEIE